MNDSRSRSDSFNPYSPRFEFDKPSPGLLDTPNKMDAFCFSPKIFDRKSPILTLNFNSSPKDRRSEKAVSIASDDPFHLTLSPPETERKFKPKLNPAVLQKKKDKENARQTAPPPRMPVLAMPKPAVKTEPEHFEPEDLNKGSTVAAETTVFESNLKSETAPPEPLFPKGIEGSLFFSDSEEEEMERNRKENGKWRTSSDLPIKKMVKTLPLFNFFNQKYNDKTNKPVFDLQNRYELLIVQHLLKHYGPKGAASVLLTPASLAVCIDSPWKDPIRKRTIFGFILRAAMKTLRVRFGYVHDLNHLPVAEVKERFRKHYFQQQVPMYPAVLTTDFESSKAVLGLNKDHIRLLLDAKEFQADFNKFIKEDFSRILNQHRRHRLAVAFLQMEEIFLSTRTEDDAVAKICLWIESARFRWVYSNAVYLQALDGARKR